MEGVDANGINTGITIQVADVKKTLASVGKMTDADNTIIFSKGRSIITADKSGDVARAALDAANPRTTTELEKKNGVYSFDIWLHKLGNEFPSPCNSAVQEKSKNYKNIASISQDFHWLDDEVF